MGVIIGIDVGGSTTKIVGFTPEKELIKPITVKADDPHTSIYGAFGKFTDMNHLSLSEIDKIMVTGVGSSYITKPIYGLNCEHISEFNCIGLGGLYLSKLSKAIVVSMGTGTALVKAEEDCEVEYLGGTGVGGGTLVGLSSKLLGVSDIQNIVELACEGDLSNIDLSVAAITNKDYPGMSSKLTAANFGNVSDLASKGDLALGIINMIFETIAMLSLFAARSKKIYDVVLTGNMTAVPQAERIFCELNKIFEANFVIPNMSQYATVIGAALTEVEKIK